MQKTADFRQIRIFLNSRRQLLKKRFFLENRWKYVESDGKKQLLRKKFGNYLTGMQKEEKKEEKKRNGDKNRRKGTSMKQEQGS